MKLIKEKNLESIPCEICNVSDEQELSTRDRNGKYLRTVICKQCGLVYTSPRPIPSAIEEYYKHSYRLDYKGVCQPKKKHILRAAMVAINRIKRIQEYIFSGMKALDVGSGGGEMVYAMRLAGADCRGLEPNKGYALYARDILGLPISIGYVENTSLPENYYDIVTMYHVIKHVYSPLRTLRNIHSCLKLNGILVVECPNIEAHCQTPSHRLHAAHLYNFNEVTLQSLGEKTGFQLIRTSISSDGGNILSIFRKKENVTLMLDVSKNYLRVMKAWTSHTYMKYLLSSYAYKKLLNKGIQFFHEKRKTLFIQDKLKILQKTFAEQQRQKVRSKAKSSLQ
jgi:2-polyprenyl-3-methyl-5-hydroxy-6-metoxy-1,4-benzoquinol methylase